MLRIYYCGGCDIMESHYTSEKHTQMLIELLKFHKIRKIVASPGTTNICLVASLQQDSYFQIYSSVDERSAAYIACGLARECGEPVALSCTGATASRNYYSGLTEAFYSNLPILAITSTQHPGRVGQLMPQVIDRSNPVQDIVRKSIQLNAVYSAEDEWAANVAINDALLELRRHGGGPVHINLMTTYSSDFSIKELPKVRGIRRYFYDDVLPPLERKKILIIVGARCRWTNEMTSVVDEFCLKYNAAVVCEPISNYRGKYGVYSGLFVNQEGMSTSLTEVDVLIHIGGIAGFGSGGLIKAKEVWRVHRDGEVRDTFKKLTNVFEMSEVSFFKYFNTTCTVPVNKETYFEEFHSACMELENKVGDLPFSNPWIVKQMIPLLPDECELHIGILNSLRAWTLFEIDHKKNVEIYSNTGGFGIDGLISTLLGSALAMPNKLFIGAIGDLAFFYDMNSIGNRHMVSNMRLLVVNNGRGTEFRNYNHPAARFKEDADAYMAAAGHYGNKSRDLIRHYSQDLGFEYQSASTKEEFIAQIQSFLEPSQKEKPIIFEVFTDSQDESDALNTLFHLDGAKNVSAKKIVKSIIGEKHAETIKKIIKK